MLQQVGIDGGWIDNNLDVVDGGAIVEGYEVNCLAGAVGAYPAGYGDCLAFAFEF